MKSALASSGGGTSRGSKRWSSGSSGQDGGFDGRVVIPVMVEAVVVGATG